MKKKLKFMDFRTVYVDGESRVSVLPKAHERSLELNKSMADFGQVLLVDTNHKGEAYSKVLDIEIDEEGLPWAVVNEEDIPEDFNGFSPQFVPLERDGSGISSYRLDHIAVMRGDHKPKMPFKPTDLVLIEGEDVASKEEIEAELNVERKRTAKLEKQLDAMKETADETKKAIDDLKKEQKDALKVERTKNQDYEVREKKVLLEKLTDNSKKLFGDTEEDQLKAAIPELERMVKVEEALTPKEEEAPEEQQEEAPAEEPKGKVKLPPGIPPASDGSAPDPAKDALDVQRRCDLASRKKFGMLPKDYPGYDEINVEEFADFFKEYNPNVR